MTRLDITRVPINRSDDSARLQTLYVVNDMLKQAEADGLDIQVILPRVLQIAIAELGASSGSILVTNNFYVEYAWLIDDNNHHRAYHPFLNEILTRGLAGWVIRNQQPALIENTLTDPRWVINPDDPSATIPRSAISAPLITRSRTIGTLTVTKSGQGLFNHEDLNLLVAITSQAASTIENARLYEESQRQLRVSTLLNEASKVINSSLDINEIMQSLLAQMNELLKVEALSIALVDKQRNELVYEVAEGIGSDKIVGLRLPSNQGVSGWVMEHGQPALVPDTHKDPRFSGHGDQRTGYDTRALICAPLQVKGEVLGTIQALNPIQGNFTEKDLNLLVNLANLASSAIANAQQFARTQAAEARYLGLFEDSIDPIILTDENGQIVEVNRPACKFFGYERAEMLQLSLDALHPKETRPLAKIQLANAKISEVTVFTSQAVTQSKDRIPVEVYAKRIVTGDNAILQWIHHDISKQVELEEMREDLMAMLFHDLQNPIGNIIASLQMLDYELPPDGDPILRSILDIAMRSSQRLQTLVRSLLDINRLEAGHPISDRTTVDIYKVVDEAVEMVLPVLERRNLQLVRKLAPGLPALYVDEDMIRRVLINLLDNAMKFSPDNYTITIEVAKAPWAQMLENGSLIFSISDQGAGILEQYREVIFNKFRRIQVKGGPKGLGLGLAFCRLAVEAHGGRIWVDDAPVQGARFNFVLPITTAITAP
ncbi:MAG: GAF domain-containing protein [Chloroflexi bacterium]|nr:GAF domain-containing protein [Chloroflexota bacterium]MCI0580944.1 GAF domain-containing protein [Chloroflexota bacterium]MCI0645032.1 GAF domain-containing protein [Chloroflexota bacterium]MCI0725607.1 GAF domain-containing protein [Chloroflexota bacterium]